MRLVAVCVLALVALVALAACGGDDAPDAAEPPTTTDPPPPATSEPGGRPPEEPPATDEGGPPPASIELPSGAAWMAYGSYNWDGATFDILRPTCDDTAVPELELGAGDIVRFHLPFEPATAELTLGADNDRPEVVSLPPGRTIEWRGEYDGLLWLAVTAPEGEVAYQACVRVS